MSAPTTVGVIHWTVVDVRGGRRILDRRGRRHNVCGAEPTVADLEARDFRSCLKDAAWASRLCPTCLAQLRVDDEHTSYPAS